MVMPPRPSLNLCVLTVVLYCTTVWCQHIQPTDTCRVNPCRHNGICIQLPDGTHRCECPDQWSGHNCTLDVDECMIQVLNRCHRYAKCTNVPGTYTCTCNAGFQGDGFLCQDEDACKTNPCVNGGVCINEITGYTCSCVDGWTGRQCMTDIDDCLPNPCQNQGTCFNGRNSFSCQCLPGFTGPQCQHRETLIPDKTDSEQIHGDDVSSGPHKFISGFPVGNSLHYKLYVSMNGYLMFDSTPRFINPPTGVALKSDMLVVAPFWTDVSTTGSQESVLRVSVYSKKNTGDIRLLSDISAMSQLQIDVTTALVATWHQVVPYPAKRSTSLKNSTFQVVLATDSFKTVAIFNYDPVNFNWACSLGEHITIGHIDLNGKMKVLSNTSSAPNDPCSFSQQTNRGIKGRWVVIVGSVLTNQKKVCLDWVAQQNLKNITDMIAQSEPCPCSRMQAQVDQRFMYNATTLSARSRFVHANTIQTCNYDSSVHGTLLKGFPNGGHAIVEGMENTIDNGWAVCCKPTDNYCSLFYGVWPSDTCLRYSAPILALVWGDPHVMTLDGYEYTFNGWGEYVILDLPKLFLLQGRTSEVEGSNNKPSRATVLTAIAAKTTASDLVEIRYNTQSPNSLHISINGSHVSVVKPINYFHHVMVEVTRQQSIIVAFSHGMSIEVHAHHGFLSMTVSLPQIYFNGQSRGLLGVADGDYYNDIVFRNGSALNTTNVSEQILFEFGQSWLLQPQESLFTYLIDGPIAHFSDFQNHQFTPTFYSDLASTNLSLLFQSNHSLMDHARQVCNNTYACLIDYAATGNEALAVTTNHILSRTLSKIETLGNSPPKFLTLPYYLTIMAGVQFELALNVFDNDTDDKLLFSLDTNLPGTFSIKNNMLRWLPPLSLRGVQGYLKIKVHDSYNASDLYWPELHVCSCDSETQCNWDEINAIEKKTSLDRYYTGLCNCEIGFKGNYCEEPYDICTLNPCYPSVECGVSNGTIQCGPCPSGLHGDGFKCYDINECDDHRLSSCEQGCMNTPGSYMCTCAPGYRVLHNHCEDINECKIQMCGTGQYCYNLPGSFECRCLPGYMQMQSRCEKAVNVSRYAGHVRFITTLRGTVWSPQLTNKTARIYSEIVDDVTTSMIKVFNSSATSFSLLHVEIIHIRNGSVIADFDLYFTKQLSQGNLDQAVDEAFRGCSHSCRLHSLLAVDRNDVSVTVKDFCSTESNPCDKSSSLCDSVNGTFVCRCRTGFKPSQLYFNSVCDDIDECVLDVCGTATCHNTVGSYQCLCDDGFVFYKNTCVNPCAGDPCSNGGTCMGQADLSYVCMCKDGWLGDHCDEEADDTHAGYWKNIMIIVASCVGAICITLFVILCAIFFRRRQRHMTAKYSDVHSIHSMHSVRSATSLSRKRPLPSGCGSYPGGSVRDGEETWQRRLPPPPPRGPYEDMEMKENMNILRNGSQNTRYSYPSQYSGMPNMGYDSNSNSLKHNPHYGYTN